MPKFEFISHSPEQTIALGRQLAKNLAPPMLVLLSGELGSGKTTLTKGIISGLGAGREEEVTSPTYTLVHVFGKAVKVFHADLYRVENFADLETLALEDALSEPAVVIIEWSERFSIRCDWPRVVVSLEHSAPVTPSGAPSETAGDAPGETRRITISGPTVSADGLEAASVKLA